MRVPKMQSIAAQIPQFQLVQASDRAKQARVMRRPQHKFNLKSKAYEITPVMIAPVLPGETLDSFLMQAHVVSDPIQNSLIGWHQEYYFFYVKHRALAAWDTAGVLQSMMLDASQSTATLKLGANSTPYYTFNEGMDYVQACHRAVITEYFRDEGETWNADLGEFYPMAQIDQEQWFNSLKKESALVDDSELPGLDDLEELDILPTFTTQYAQWELMRDQGMTDLTYEDYLRSYGVSIPKSEDLGGTPDEMHRPELIRFFRNWTYPSNVINPTDGAAKSAVYWDIKEKADKKRFFKEPGFIYGVSVTRPKIYLGNQKGAAVGFLNDAYSWLPAVLAGLPYTSVKETLDTLTTGIFQNQNEDYWVDAKDLFLYGDQFVNHALTAAANHGIGLPVTNTLAIKYPTDAMAKSLFVTALSEYIRQDGVVHLNILGRQWDTTP